MQLRLRTGVELSRSQVPQVIAARGLNNFMLSELESLAERVDPANWLGLAPDVAAA